MKKIPALTDKDKSRFWSKVNKTDTCWVWTRTKTRLGCGVFYIRDTPYLAHRVAFSQSCDLVNGMHCCHRCDNPICVNPEHLFLGTHSDNMKDCESKGRRKHVSGENHPQAKLTSHSVYQMRMLYSCGDISLENLGKKFGTSLSNTARIIHNKIWTT